MKVAPSILSADFAHLGRDVQQAERAGGDVLHVDVMDGHFVDNLTFGPNVVSALRPSTNLPMEVHLMVADPAHWLSAFAQAGADTLLVHQEATQHLYGVLQTIAQLRVSPGVVINPGTPISAIEPVLPLVDQVLVMTVNPGFGGQAFLPDMLQKVTALRALRDRSNLDFTIEVDGGVNASTSAAVAAAGVDLAVSGSYLFGAADMTAAIATLKGAAHDND